MNPGNVSSLVIARPAGSAGVDDSKERKKGSSRLASGFIANSGIAISSSADRLPDWSRSRRWNRAYRLRISVAVTIAHKRTIGTRVYSASVLADAKCPPRAASTVEHPFALPTGLQISAFWQICLDIQIVRYFNATTDSQEVCMKGPPSPSIDSVLCRIDASLTRFSASHTYPRTTSSDADRAADGPSTLSRAIRSWCICSFFAAAY